MRFRVLPDELNNGETLVSVGKKRIDEFMAIVASRSPITLVAPVVQNGRSCAIIIPLEVLSTETSRHRLRFKPVWVKCYKVCHLRSTQVKALVCDFDGTQVLFDQCGAEPSTYTLSGEGVDPAITREADTELARLMDSNGSNPAVQSAVAYLKRQAA